MLGLCIATVTVLGSQLSFLDQVSEYLKTDPSKAESLIRQRFKAEDLKVGIPPHKEGVKVLFAIDAGPGKHEAEVSGENFPAGVEFKPCGSILVSVATLRSGLGTTIHYSVDGERVKKDHNLEVYASNPTCDQPPGGRKGELRDMGELKSITFPNTTRKWSVYLPPDFDPATEHPVLIGTDAQWDREWQVNALENCAREGKIPATVGIFLEPGQDKPGNYSNRSFEYDRLSPDYSNFLLTEIFPEVEKIVKLSPDPAKRACVGVSSGGICGFTSCWQRPDQFSTVISAVGSFDNIAHGKSLVEGGHNYPFLIRLTDNKPIHVFLQDGTNDLDNKFGNWFLGNAQMASALKFKGYDVQWHPGEGFHSSDHLRSIFDQALIWWIGTQLQ